MVDKARNRQRFLDVWPSIPEEFTRFMAELKMPENATQWIRKMLDYNTPGGKLNRGISVVDTVELLLGKELEGDEYHRVAILGWCVELLQAFFLVADDMMDTSVTRRGQPCWYRAQSGIHPIAEVGSIAINDSFILEGAIYHLLKKYFRQETYYVDLLELFHDTTFLTEIGQLLDLITAPEHLVDLTQFSLGRHNLIVIYKTAYYSFYLPVVLALYVTGIATPANLQTSKDILIPLGTYFQVQDDFLDCFGTPEQIGKIGTDIMDNKCSWCVNVALERCSKEQRKVLDENYGKKDAVAESKVKEVFSALDLPTLYNAYEQEAYVRIGKLIDAVDESPKDEAPIGMKREVFRAFLEKIYKRTK